MASTSTIVNSLLIACTMYVMTHKHKHKCKQHIHRIYGVYLNSSSSELSSNLPSGLPGAKRSNEDRSSHNDEPSEELPTEVVLVCGEEEGVLFD